MRTCPASVIAVLALATSDTPAQPVDPVGITGGPQGPFFAPGAQENASDAACFTFTLASPLAADIDINRSTADLDLIATLYSGNVAGFDATAAFGQAFDALESSGGPLTFLALEDETEDDPFGGPFADPRFTLQLQPGTYSLLVTSLFPFSDDEFTIESNIPAPPPPSTCPPGTTPENNPDCFNGFNQSNDANGGCASGPDAFFEIGFGETVCGESGTFLNTFTGLALDRDAYRLPPVSGGLVDLTLEAEFEALMVLVDLNGGCPSPFVELFVIPAMTPTTVTTPPLNGDFAVIVTPFATDDIGCGLEYTLTADSDGSCTDGTRLDLDGIIGILDPGLTRVSGDTRTSGSSLCAYSRSLIPVGPLPMSGGDLILLLQVTQDVTAAFDVLTAFPGAHCFIVSGNFPGDLVFNNPDILGDGSNLSGDQADPTFGVADLGLGSGPFVDVDGNQTVLGATVSHYLVIDGLDGAEGVATFDLILEPVDAACVFTGCNPADVNEDGALTFGDVTAFTVAFNAGDVLPVCADGDASADTTGDGILTFGDVTTFVDNFNSGAGCP